MGTDIYLHAEKRSGDVWLYCGELKDLEDRNYQFFAILANVRNRIRSTVPFDYVDHPRGLPEDMSEELSTDPMLHGGDHPSWVTLQELQDFDWNGKTILRTAVVDPSVAHLFCLFLRFHCCHF